MPATGQAARARPRRRSPATLARALAAEVFGTFALTLVAAGGLVISVVSHGQVDATARALAPGLMVVAMIYAIGDVSGAHINPSVTLAFALRGDFPWRHVPLYWLAQLAGALLAPALLLLLFGDVAHLGTTIPHAGNGTAVVMEIVLTTLLASVILGTATRGRIVGPSAALPVGATVALAGLFAGPISGASMNPALSLGPALVSGTLATAWIYLVGPFLGAGLAVLLTWIHHGRKHAGEELAARGDDQPAG
ncbi:MAG TPA: aquaporin [Thermomicrobiaceae bacterium]|nr:aquaporin [Thermomicrobiaceae bacterium]